MKDRIKYLDGVRGVAILLVILFHTYARHLAMPYGAQFFEIWILKYGWVGVELFFLLSGFVIFMTLEKCSSLKEFLLKRWLRLFPAMFLACIFLYSTAGLFSERFGGQPELYSLLPSLTFTHPRLWEVVLQYPVQNLEGSFWSLYVEVSFYFFSGIIYFKVVRRNSLKTIWAIFSLFAITVLIIALGKALNVDLIVLVGKVFGSVLGFLYFGWFAVGAMLYCITQHTAHGKQHRYMYYLVLILLLIANSIITGYITRETLDAMIAVFVITLFFPLSLFSLSIQKVLAHRFWVFLGFVSYPLYLIHERTLVSATVLLAKHYSGVPSYILPIVPIFILIFISWVIAKFLEVPLRKFLKDVFIVFCLKKEKIKD